MDQACLCNVWSVLDDGSRVTSGGSAANSVCYMSGAAAAFGVIGMAEAVRQKVKQKTAPCYNPVICPDRTR